MNLILTVLSCIANRIENVKFDSWLEKVEQKAEKPLAKA